MEWFTVSYYEGKKGIYKTTYQRSNHQLSHQFIIISFIGSWTSLFLPPVTFVTKYIKLNLKTLSIRPPVCACLCWSIGPSVSQSVRPSVGSVRPSGPSVRRVRPSVRRIRPSGLSVRPSVRRVRAYVGLVRPSGRCVRPSVYLSTCVSSRSFVSTLIRPSMVFHEQSSDLSFLSINLA